MTRLSSWAKNTHQSRYNDKLQLVYNYKVVHFQYRWDTMYSCCNAYLVVHRKICTVIIVMSSLMCSHRTTGFCLIKVRLLFSLSVIRGFLGIWNECMDIKLSSDLSITCTRCSVVKIMVLLVKKTRCSNKIIIHVHVILLSFRSTSIY